MQDQALDQCTNIPDWWMECGLSIDRHALWHLNHKDAAARFGSNPWPVIKGQASWSCAEKIFVVAHEGLIGQAHDQLNADPRLHVWDCLMYTSHVRSRPYLFWFDWTREVANQLDSLDRLDHTPIAKPFVFECMLGLAKPWREYIYNRALKHANILLGYQGRTPWVPGTDLDHDITASAVSTDRVAYAGEQQCNLSVLIPYKIYNSSWFSIVSETVMDRAFVSEKTAKVLLGKRLFVWFGAHRGLHHLKTFGFKTFDNVIDESYDDIQSPSERIQRAWQQVEHLLTLDPKWVHDQVRDRLSHNQQVLLGMTPKQTVIRQIQNLAQGA